MGQEIDCVWDFVHVPPLPAGQLMAEGVLVIVPLDGRVTVSVCVKFSVTVPPPPSQPPSGQSAAAGRGSASASIAQNRTTNRLNANSSRCSVGCEPDTDTSR
jgi:hypothetical protein